MNTKISQEEIVKHKYSAKYIKIVKQTNVCDLTYLDSRRYANIKKISKNQYIKIRRKETDRGVEIISDGEVYEFIKRGGDIMRNKRSLRKIFTDLRYLINTNYTADDADKQLFITLTYKENMQNDKKLYNDFKKFLMRLQYGYRNQHELSYIVIMEPQGRGAWHCHLLLKTLNQSKLVIPWCHILRVWGHGAIKVERLCNNNIGSYFVAYLSNAEVTDDNIKELEISPDDVTVKDGKKYIKGERMKYYPDYMQIYRHSRNVLHPDKTVLKALHDSDTAYNDAVEVAQELYPQLTYEALKEIEIDNKTLKIVKEQRRK